MISVKIVADSINGSGIRLTTVECVYPRFIHAQLMTHRVFSRSASSSRAIPVNKLIDAVEADPAMPMSWGKNQRGMQATETFGAIDEPALKSAWLSARDAAVYHAKRLAHVGVHKQIVNRILEPFSHIHVVITATEWDNFFNLRRHDAAQPEIQALANHMFMVRAESTPVGSSGLIGGWHLPYILPEEREKWPVDALLMYSVARCARVSYTNHGTDKIDHEKDAILHDTLLQEGHMSPFEHQARPVEFSEGNSNFKGWRQYRKTIPNEAVFNGKTPDVIT
jgi:thymidylate synthase ThyX